MKKNLTKKGSKRYFPQGLFFLNQGDRARQALRHEYRWLAGYKGMYFCDQYGHIYSACQNAIRKKSLHQNTTGYLRFTTSNGKQRMVGPEVLRAWRGLAPAGQECAHLDDVRTNNCITNLRWTERGKAGDLKKIVDGTANGLSVNGSNRLDANWNRSMRRQANLMLGHTEDCGCRVCELRDLPEAWPLGSSQRALLAL